VSGGYFRPTSAMLTTSSLQPCPLTRNEDYAPSYETLDPFSSGASSAVPDASSESPTKDTSSIRKSLMGSLRKQKLRSISSLRSLRSPTRTRQSDTAASPLAEVVVPPYSDGVPAEPIPHRIRVPRNTALTRRSYSTSRNHPLVSRYSISTAKTASPQP
jgi:hypothetical protein